MFWVTRFSFLFSVFLLESYMTMTYWEGVRSMVNTVGPHGRWSAVVLAIVLTGCGGGGD